MLLSIYSSTSRQGSWAFLECRPCVNGERMFHLYLISLLQFSVAERPWGNLRYSVWWNNLSKEIFDVCVQGKSGVHCSIPTGFFVFCQVTSPYANMIYHPQAGIKKKVISDESQTTRVVTRGPTVITCIVTVIRGSWKLAGVPRKSMYMDGFLSKDHALIEAWGEEACKKLLASSISFIRLWSEWFEGWKPV